MEKNIFKAAAAAGGSLEETKLGVWRVLTEKDDQTALGFAMRWKKMTAILPTIQKFVADVYMLGPGLLTLIFLSQLWSGCVRRFLVAWTCANLDFVRVLNSVEHVLLLHFANRVLSIVRC
jgi:hypothetical protein